MGCVDVVDDGLKIIEVYMYGSFLLTFQLRFLVKLGWFVLPAFLH